MNARVSSRAETHVEQGLGHELRHRTQLRPHETQLVSDAVLPLEQGSLEFTGHRLPDQVAVPVEHLAHGSHATATFLTTSESAMLNCCER
jgi:hypothetical protein